MKRIPTNQFQFKIVWKDNRKTVELNSRTFFQHFINQHTTVGDIGSMTLKMKKPTRSEAQLAYYAVIVGLIAHDTGNTWEDVHSGLMILNWGKKKIKIGNKTVEVRKSVSDNARIRKDEMSEQIEFALKEAKDLKIKVPTRQELGYIDN